MMRPPPPSRHTNFFSSLRQVEKRLKLENHPQSSNLSTPPPPPLPQPEINYSSTESLSSPLYLKLDQPSSNNGSTIQESEPPREFLSNSLDFPPTQQDPPQPNCEIITEIAKNGLDDIDLLIQLLGLGEGDEHRRVDLSLRDDCGDEFYAKVVGVKGPKCGKEVERLDRWIEYFSDGGGERRREPLRLAHLLLGKAAFLSQDSDGFEGFRFPSTVEEFLQNDPPR